MDQMDIEHTVDVPDTPDRLTTQRINVSDSAEGIRRSSTPCHLGRQKLIEESTKDHPVLIDSGSRRLSRHPPKTTGNSGNSRHPITSAPLSVASPSSSRNAHLLRKGVTEKKSHYVINDSAHTQHLQTVRPSCISKSSSQDNSFVDLTEGNLHRPVIGKASQSRVQKNNPADFRNRSGLANSASSSHGVTKFSDSSCNASEETGNMNRVGLNTDFRKGLDVVGNIQNEPGDGGFLSLDPIAPPRVNKQKRLVRNGCISPNNIVNARQLAGKDISGSADIANNNRGSMATSAPVSIGIRELVAEDNDSHAQKGKGLISHPCSSTASDLINKKFHGSVKDVGTGDYTRCAGKSIEESRGWRSTRNHTRKMNISSRREMDAPGCSSLHHDNRSERKKKGICAGTGDDCPKDQNLFSSEHDCSQSLRESISHPGIRLGQLKGPRSTADTLIKRRKQGSYSSCHGESSISVSNDPEVVFLRSSSEATNPESTSSHADYFQQIVEVDELSPQLRHNALDEDARARQVEADEILARELQEQLYNEVPAFGVEEVNEHIALALQHQDDLNHGFSRARRRVLNARGSVMSNSHRQSQSRSSSVPRRGSLARGSTLGRMTRLRNRFPGQPRTLLPSRGRTSMFPADMDVEMRMHILGALEEFSDMGTTTAMLQGQRDFNENDYEMLLALDENNDQHRGMPIHRINGLPQSTVQSDDFEEACAICLDTPTIGDTIRHLPCLHKFHKDCIDPWLRQRTSCPVCKSSVT